MVCIVGIRPAAAIVSASLLWLPAGCAAAPRAPETGPTPRLSLPASASLDETEARFARADAHARRATADLATDPVALGRWLAAPFDYDADKARAIFTWMAENIAYDAEGYIRGEIAAKDHAEILASGMAVCGGYASLFEAIADGAGLEVRTIDGAARGQGAATGADVGATLIRHAWVEVEVDGRWRILEPTWGAGFVDVAQRRFVKQFAPSWFFVDPDDFAFTHEADAGVPHTGPTRAFPCALAERAYLWPEGKALGVRPVSHLCRQAPAAGEAVITFAAPEDAKVWAAWRSGAPAGATATFDGEAWVLVVSPTRAATLDIYVGAPGARTAEAAISYEITPDDGRGV